MSLVYQKQADTPHYPALPLQPFGVKNLLTLQLLQVLLQFCQRDTWLGPMRLLEQNSWTSIIKRKPYVPLEQNLTKYIYIYMYTYVHNDTEAIKENFKENGHFMAFPIWTYLNHEECGIPWQGLVSRKRQGGLEHLQVPGTKFLWKDKDLHQAARRSAPAPFVEPSSIIFLKILKPNFLPCNRRELEHWGYRASHAAPSFAHRWRLRHRPGISESEFEKNKSNLKELEGTKKRRKGRRHQALSPSKNIISGAVSSTESRHSSSVHPHVWFLNHFEGPVSCPFMPRKVKTCAIPILQYWSSMHCMHCMMHFDNIMLTLCLHCDYLGMMVPRCCLSSERSRCIDCMSLSTCPSMCPRWEDSCSSAAVHRFDQATESTWIDCDLCQCKNVLESLEMRLTCWWYSAAQVCFCLNSPFANSQWGDDPLKSHAQYHIFKPASTHHWPAANP